METMVAIIMTWLSINFGLPPEPSYPQIEFHPQQAISQIWIGNVALQEGMDVSAAKREIRHRDIHAFYDDSRQTIFLVEGWNLESPRDLSVLVHELVHHLQNLDGRQYACPAEREKLAYQAQDAWLGLFRTSLEKEFEIDALTLLVSTKCMH